MEYVVTIDAVNINTSSPKTFYFSGGVGFTSSPSSSPANTFFDPRLNRPYEARRDMFDKSTTYGAVSMGVGEITLNNTDGFLDSFCTDYAINGRDVKVYVSENWSNNFPADYTLVGKVKAVLAQSNDKAVTVSLKDKMKDLDKPLLQSKYLGNNLLPFGTEGVEDDLKESRKPRVYGRVMNISPYFVNTARLIFQVSDKPCAVTALYSRGVGWASDGNYAAFADLQNDALEPAQSKYKVYSGSEGTYIRLGSVPAGTLTCDAETSEQRASELIKAIALDGGIHIEDISNSDFTAMSAYAYPCGVWVTEETTTAQAMSIVASAIGAYFSFDRFGVLRIGRLELPTTATLSLYEDQYMAFDLMSTSDADDGIPAKTLTLLYAKNYTPQTDLDDTAASARSSFAKIEYRKAVVNSASAAALYANAPEMELQTSLINYVDAAFESARRIGLLQHKRVYSATVRITPEMFPQADIGECIKIYHSRWGLSNGKVLRVIGMTYNFFLHEITFRLWG